MSRTVSPASSLPDPHPRHPPVIRCADGRRFRLTGGTAAEFLLHRHSLKFLIPCALIFATLDRGFGLSALLAGILAMLLLAVVLAWAQLLRLALAGRRIGALYSPALTLPLFGLASGTVWLVAMLFDMPPPPAPDWIRMTLRDLFVVACMDLAFSQFVAPVHPLLRALDDGTDQHAAPAPAPRPAPDTTPAEAQPLPLAIGPETIRVQDLISIRAEDHYLHIATTHGRRMLRARLSDATAQLDMRSGMLVNRSAWIAFAAVDVIDDDGRGGVDIRLRDGSSERLAQSRRIAFQNAMALRAKG